MSLERGNAVAHVHDSMGELYPIDQAFTANIIALVSRGAVWKDVKETLDTMRAEIETALGAVDTKLATLSKMVQDRAALRIDIETHTKDIAKYEADPKAGPKLDVSKAKLAEAQEKFHTTESVLVPELEHLDKEIANLTTSAFQSFIQAQITYNQVVLDAYYAGLSAVPVAPTEVSNVTGDSSSSSSTAVEGGEATVVPADVTVTATTTEDIPSVPSSDVPPSSEAPSSEAPSSEAPSSDAPVPTEGQ